MRRLCGHLPDGLHQLHLRPRRGRSAHPTQRPGAQSHSGSLRRLRLENRPGHGEGRGRVLALWIVRGALPDGCLGYAEVLPRDGAVARSLPAPARRRARNLCGGRRVSKVSPIRAVNDFVVKFANVNGSGSASANLLFAKAILRMGVPVAPRNIFPSNIQGLPTWFEVRVSEAGWRGRRGGVDLMVAMNPQTWDQDLKEIEPGGYLFYDSTKALPPSKFRDDVNAIGMPLTEICNREYSDTRQRQLFKNIIYVG